MTTPLILPEGKAPAALTPEYFPTRQQAFIWRNWEMVPARTLAEVLGTNDANVLALAKAMGLRVPPQVSPQWLRRGYVTLIRNNWHLLPYEQLLQLLGWSEAKMDFHLREDDFLFIKLGELKPRCEPIRYAPLTSQQAQATEHLRQLIETHFASLNDGREEPPFAFIDRLSVASTSARRGQTNERFDLRLIYPYFATYGDPLLDREIDPLPETFLARLAEMGINGVWMQAVLYALVRWSPAPKMSTGWEKRIETLAMMAERAKKFGVGLYLYLNEPRSMPVSVFETCPQCKGVEETYRGLAAMCTSAPGTLAMLRENVESVFRSAPALAGAFTITMSENLTHCHSHYQGEQCPRCSQRSAAEVVAEVNAAIEGGIHAANPDARVIAWTWGWHEPWDRQAVDLLPKGVDLMCTSERYLPTHVGGVDGHVQDYSISQVGPANNARTLWKRAIDRGMRAVAKVQMNTSWECSAMPYIPAVDLVDEHLAKLEDCGVSGLMVAWTLGGFPGGNLALLTQSLNELAEQRFGNVAPLVRAAWKQFSDAFREFPFDVRTIYFGPANVGPMNPLFLKPSGYAATMVGFPYDDLTLWRAMYPEDVFVNQLKLLSEMWNEGLPHLVEAKQSCDAAHRNAINELWQVAEATYCHFRSAYLQSAFIQSRDGDTADRCRRMQQIAEEEISLAKRLYVVARQNATIGFEASNHYAYTLNDLKEKVLNAESVRQALMESA